jgi:hypothetical protein
MSNGMNLAASQPDPGHLPAGGPISSADPAHWRQQQAAAEDSARVLQDFLAARPGEGLTVGTTGADPQPLAVTGDPAVTGVPWDQQ